MNYDYRNLMDYPFADFTGYRLLEVPDLDICMDTLKGDCFTKSMNPTLSHAELKEQEKEFEERVSDEGVYGYVLEKWNPKPGIGWEHVDSCWGFVGRYRLENDHYVIEELTRQAVEEIEKRGK